MIPRLTFDLETYLIKPGQIIPKPVAGAVCIYDGNPANGIKGPVLASIADITTEVIKAINNGWLIVGHNVVFDLACLWRAWPALGPLIWHALENGQVSDTLVREKLIKCAEGRLDFDWKLKIKDPKFNLAALVHEYLDLDISESKNNPDSWRLRYSELDGVPFDKWPKEAIQYVLDDVRLTDSVWILQCTDRFVEGAGQFVNQGRVTNEVEQTRAAWVLFLITAWGMVTDEKRVTALELRINTEMVTAAELLKTTGFLKKGGSRIMKAIKAAVQKAYGDKGLQTPMTDPSKKFPDGQVKTDEATLKEMDDPALNKILEYNGIKKLLTDWVMPVLKKGITGTIHPNYDVLKSTGRTSSFGRGKGDRKEGCNIQQPPRKGGVRECFKPRPGYVYIDCDYGTIELAALAQVCYTLFGYSKIRDALIEGKDLHLVTAAAIMEMPVGSLDIHSPEVKEMRQTAKMPNFGVPGGMGPETFCFMAKTQFGVEISLEKGTQFIAAFKTAYPEVVSYFAWISKETNNPHGAFNLTQLFSNRVRGSVQYTQAANSMFQGLAADGAKHALWLISKECYIDKESPLYGTRMVAFIHDEVLAECPEATAPEAADRLSALMVEGMKAYLPDVPVRAEPALMRYWYKDAESLRDSNGRLQIWEPEVQPN